MKITPSLWCRWPTTHCYGDRIQCKVFLTTLVDSAQSWFEGISSQSIQSFEDFQKLFLHHFSSSKKYKKTVFILFEVKQSSDEILRAYIKDSTVLLWMSLSAPRRQKPLHSILREGDFFRSLTKKLPGDFEDLLARAEKYINMEEAQKQKREALKRERGDRVVRPEERAQKRGNSGHFSNHVPLRIARDREVQECSSDRAREPNPSAQYARLEKKGLCTLHKECCHDTSECRSNAEERIQASFHTRVQPTKQKTEASTLGNLASRAQFIWWTTKYPGGRRGDGESSMERGNREPEKKKASSPALGVIKMISGRSTDGDSNRARKARGRKNCLEVDGEERKEPIISFGPDDLRGVSLSHNDVLVIQARVANYDVMRVFLNSGSSVNVIFKEALVQMDLQGYQLESVETALFGFAGHAVYPKGEIMLPLTLSSAQTVARKI